MTPQEAQARLQAALQALNARQPAQAKALLDPVVAFAPRNADTRFMMGRALMALGDPVAGERELKLALAADKRQPAYHTALGELMASQNKPVEAERAFRAALTLNRRYISAARELAFMLVILGRPAEALQLTIPLVGMEPGNTDQGLLAAHANALKALKRYEEALDFYSRAADLAPSGAVGQHNLAAIFVDLGRFADAIAARDRSAAAGLDAPEGWLIRGRALQGLDRLDEAEAAFREAILRRPAYHDAVQNLAQLTWMRTEDAGRAAAIYDRALAAAPPEQARLLMISKAALFEYAGDAGRAYASVEPLLATDDADAHVSALHAAAQMGKPELALSHGRKALMLAPRSDSVLGATAAAALSAHHVDEASRIVADLLKLNPKDQYALALQATCWRMLGDPRYEALYDYAAFVKPRRIDTPQGWPDLKSYLADLAEGLKAMHRMKTHPVGQSLRQGTQSNHGILNSENPAVRAFSEAIDGPIRAYMQELELGRDVLRSRNTGDYRLAGIWSVRLRPGGGHHADHVHPEGWLSSACYIELPGAVEAGAHEGWIKFGEPGLPIDPPLKPEHFVKPEPGLLVLFPSYMWHGTVPFSGEESRLTVAFDVVPQGRR